MPDPKTKSNDARKPELDAAVDAAKKQADDAQKAWERTSNTDKDNESCDSAGGTCGMGQKTGDGTKVGNSSKKPGA